MTMTGLSLYPTPSAFALEEAEQNLSQLPPLESVLLPWQRHGLTATMQREMQALLTGRTEAVGPATLPAASLTLLCELAMEYLSHRANEEAMPTWDSRPLSAWIVRHAASLRAVETGQLLPPGVLVQKTVTIQFGPRVVLCTGVGLFTLARSQVYTIADALGLSRRMARQCRINPPDCSALDLFGMQPGMVSPFLPPGQHTGLTALVVLPLSAPCTAQEPEVALSLSLWESLLLPLHCLPDLLSEYAVRAYPAVRYLAV